MIQLNAQRLLREQSPARPGTGLWGSSLLLLLALGLGCSKHEDSPQVEGRLVAPSQEMQPPIATSPDRLPQGELMEGEEEAFSFRFPKDMKMSKTRQMARAVGTVNFDALTEYVRVRVLARHAEMSGATLIFPQVTIRGGHEGIYTFTLIEGVREQVLLIQDETKPTGTMGLDETERWKRAGLKPNGELVDPNALQ